MTARGARIVGCGRLTVRAVGAAPAGGRGVARGVPAGARAGVRGIDSLGRRLLAAEREQAAPPGGGTPDDAGDRLLVVTPARRGAGAYRGAGL